MAMTLAVARRHDPLGSTLPRELARYGYKAMCALFGARVVVEGREHLPLTPALLACNATHRYDPLTFRVAMLDLGANAATVSKGKNWHDPATAYAARTLGSLPLCSRGYLITMDFLALHGRRPTEAEYRALRDHVDREAPLPGMASLEALTTQERDVLTCPLDLARRSYREAMLAIYWEFQSEFMQQARTVVRAGRHIHMYPQGTVSSRLSEGRTGAVQIAAELGLPIVPVGMSGVRSAFRSLDGPLPARGTITIRLGQAYHLPTDALPPGFRALHPEDEAVHKTTLGRLTGDLMERISDLVSPEYGWAPGRVSDGTRGTERFA